jgi:hypothetical protein
MKPGAYCQQVPNPSKGKTTGKFTVLYVSVFTYEQGIQMILS